jgi:sec-independent protein translocase protein TatB
MEIPQTIQYASISMADSLIVMVLALVVFGPRRLPQIGRQIGKLMYEFRKASNDFKFQMEEELRNSEEADRRKKEEERLKALALAAPVADPAAAPATEAQPAEAAGSTTAESPYPWESVYPTPTPALEDASTPVIQPPATGEQVAAEPPTTVATPIPAETTPEVSAVVATPITSETPEALAKPKRRRKAAPKAKVSAEVGAEPDASMVAASSEIAETPQSGQEPIDPVNANG